MKGKFLVHLVKTWEVPRQNLFQGPVDSHLKWPISVSLSICLSPFFSNFSLPTSPYFWLVLFSFLQLLVKFHHIHRILSKPFSQLWCVPYKMSGENVLYISTASHIPHVNFIFQTTPEHVNLCVLLACPLRPADVVPCLDFCSSF